jgi:hypothetical protein
MLGSSKKKKDVKEEKKDSRWFAVFKNSVFT